MELMEVIVIITAIIAASIGVIYIIAKIANFYKLRFGFSIFSGVILMILSITLLYFSAKKQTRHYEVKRRVCHDYCTCYSSIGIGCCCRIAEFDQVSKGKNKC